MKQQNFLFVDLVSSIFLLVLLIGNFMGLLYITEGNIAISLVGSLFLVICYFFVVQLLKKNKEVMVRKNFLHASLLFWVFFLVLGYASFNLMSHFINIEYNCKDQIKSEATQKIKLVDSLSLVYNKRAKNDVQSFGAQLKTKLSAYKASKSNILRNELALEPFKVDASVLSNPDYINVDEVANAKETPYKAKIDNNIKNIEKTITLNSKKYQSVFDNWKRLSLMATYSKLNEYVDENGKLINSKIAELPLDKTPINISYNKKLLPLNNPEKLNKIFKPNYILPLIIIVVIHLFILIPFLSHKVRGYSNSGKTKRNDNGVSKQKGTIEI
jgi:hypothetical protein